MQMAVAEAHNEGTIHERNVRIYRDIVGLASAPVSPAFSPPSLTLGAAAAIPCSGSQLKHTYLDSHTRSLMSPDQDVDMFQYSTQWLFLGHRMDVKFRKTQ